MSGIVIDLTIENLRTSDQQVDLIRMPKFPFQTWSIIALVQRQDWPYRSIRHHTAEHSLDQEVAW